MKKFFLLMLSVFAFCAADAQVTTSGMNGTVTDADGQPLAGATVIAVHTPSGTQYGAVSDKNGGYNLQGLRTGGPYTVTFSFVGCQSVEFPGLMLSLGQTLKRDAFLKDSQQLEAVVITADGKNSSMNVNRAGAVTSISNEQIELMPTVNRSMNDIMRLTPQVVRDGRRRGVQQHVRHRRQPARRRFAHFARRAGAGVGVDNPL